MSGTPNQKPVLVTGVTGYIGSFLALRLLECGYLVRGTVRSLEKGEKLRSALAERTNTDGLELVEADLLDEVSWKAATEGCDEVFHVASPLFARLPKDPDELIVPAREGTLNVLKAATECGVSRVVITSSMAAIVYGLDQSPDQPLDETRFTDPDHPDNSPYTRSKAIAEQAAWQFVRETKGAPELVTIHPGAVLGPLLLDNPSDSLLLVSKMLDGEFPGVPQFGFEVVDVRDVAEIHIRAMQTEHAAGERFLAVGGFRMMKEVADVLKEACPDYRKRLPKVTLPDWLLRFFALFDADTRGVLNELGKRREATAAKARNSLGWEARPAEESIVETATSMISLGLVKEL